MWYFGTESSSSNITYSNRPDRVAQLAEHWASIPKVVGSIPTVARHIFQACPVWIYTQSNITSIIFTWVHYTNTEKINQYECDWLLLENHVTITYSYRSSTLAKYWGSSSRIVDTPYSTTLMNLKIYQLQWPPWNACDHHVNLYLPRLMKGLRAWI